MAEDQRHLPALFLGNTGSRAMNGPPLAFLSYVRFEDEHEAGRLSQLRQRLSGEVRLQTGEDFEIFQDRKDIAWGQQWRQRIEESLDAATFLIPILTPGFFRSKACRDELERFLEHEAKLGRNDLVLPVLYVNTPILADEAKRRADPLATNLAARQYLDWRELRFEPWTSPSVGRVVAKMAGQIVAALDRQTMGGQPSPGALGLPLPSTSPRGSSQEKIDSRVLTPTRESSRAFATKKEPLTLVVDAFHRGDFVTLSEAIEAAMPGNRLIIRPGIYKEEIFIDKPLEILGEGDLGDVVIEAIGSDVMIFQTNMARVVNLTLRQSGSGQYRALNIRQGRIEVEGCDFTSQGKVCILIQEGAEPRLRLNRVHHSNVGVLITRNGLGTLEDNEIHSNGSTGVIVGEGGRPKLRRNRIHTNSGFGVNILKDGEGVFEDNDLRGNVAGAWHLAIPNDPRVLRVRNLE